MNITSIIDSAAAKTPEKTMIVAAGSRWRYDDVIAASHRSAAHLKILGVGHGDRVAVMAFNTPEFIVAMIAIWRIGAALVPVNHKLSALECGFIFDHCRPKLVLASAELCATARAGYRHGTVIALDGLDADERFSPDAGAEIVERSTADVKPTDASEILYTSGTTGKPKGCIHTHGGTRHTAMLSALSFSMTPADCTLIAMPIWHAAPLNNFTLATLFVGGTIVLLREYHPLAFVRALQDERITVYFGAPVSFTMPLAMPGGLDGYDFSRVRAFLYGGGPISADVARQLAITYRTDRFHQVYGMTETGPGGTLLYPDEQVTKAGSIGRAAQPGVDMRVVCEDGSDAGPGDVGEIWLRSESMMTGYLDDPVATAAALSDGWYHTGDLARVDDDGYLTIVDRLKDMIVTGGENVYSKEVEDALYATGMIADGAVIGIPHPEWGETVVAAVIVRPDMQFDADALKAELRDHIALYKIPRRIVAVKALPRTPTGKVVKGELRILLSEDISR